MDSASVWAGLGICEAALMLARIVDMQVDEDGKDHWNKSRGIRKYVKVQKSLQILLNSRPNAQELDGRVQHGY